MVRYALRIFRADLVSWVPAMLVTMVVTAMIGACTGQYAWIHGSAFIEAAAVAGIEPSEFSIALQTVNMLVSFLSVVSLTTIGSAVVARCRQTFSLWRLVGASPAQVRICMGALMAIAAGAGACAGALAGVPLAAAATPLVSALGSQGQAFAPPPFSPSLAAVFASFFFGVVICVLGAVVPAVRASRVTAVETLRAAPPRQLASKGRLRSAAGLIVLVVALVVMAAPYLDSSGWMDASVDFGGAPVYAAAINAAVVGGFIIAFAAYLLAPMLAHLVLRVARPLANKLGAQSMLAERAMEFRLDFSMGVCSILGSVLGLAGILIVTLRSAISILRAYGVEGEVNQVDTLVFVGVICFIALVTSLAVMALSARGAAHEQALFRSLGMAPTGVRFFQLDQAILFSLVACVVALLPMLAAFAGFEAYALLAFAHPVVAFPFDFLVGAFVAMALLLFAIMHGQVHGALMRSPTCELREQ